MQSQPAAVAAEHDTVVCDIDVLNALLRGEVAAVETYDQVIAKFDGQPQAIEPQRIRDEHTEAAAVFSPDGSSLIVYGAGLQVWDTQSWTLVSSNDFGEINWWVTGTLSVSRDVYSARSE